MDAYGPGDTRRLVSRQQRSFEIALTFTRSMAIDVRAQVIALVRDHLEAR